MPASATTRNHRPPGLRRVPGWRRPPGFFRRCPPGAASGWFWLVAAGLSLATLAAGCRAGRTPPRLPDGAAVQALLTETRSGAAPAAARGRADVRLRVGERDLPLLGLSVSLRSIEELGFVLRPGVLPPVLSLWAGSDGWILLLPRERSAFEVAHEPGFQGIVLPGPAAGPDATPTISGPTLARIAAWTLLPHVLLADLADPQIRREGDEWVVAGRPAGLGGFIASAELRLAAGRGEILRWNLRSSESTLLADVSYDPRRPPGGMGRAGHRVSFALPTLALSGSLTLEHIRATEPEPGQRPPLPDGWLGRTGADLLPALARLQDGLEDGK